MPHYPFPFPRTTAGFSILYFNAQMSSNPGRGSLPLSSGQSLRVSGRLPFLARSDTLSGAWWVGVCVLLQSLDEKGMGNASARGMGCALPQRHTASGDHHFETCQHCRNMYRI